MNSSGSSKRRGSSKGEGLVGRLLEKDDGRYAGKFLEAYVYYVLDGRDVSDVVLLTGLDRGVVEELVRDGNWDDERGRARMLVGVSGVEYLRRRGMLMGMGLIEGAAKVCGEVVRKVMSGEVEVDGVKDLERVGRLMREVAKVGEVSMGVGSRGVELVFGGGGGGRLSNVRREKLVRGDE